MIEIQPDKVKMPGEASKPAPLSVRAGRGGESDPPLIVSKKWICYHFNICYNSGRTCRRLRKLVFDDCLLELLQLDETEWKRRQEFTRAETIIIINYLGL